MMGIFQKVRKIHIVFILIVVTYSFLLVNIVQAVGNGTNEPGSDGNPLVARDYVDANINALSATITDLNKQITDLKKQLEDAKAQQSGGSSGLKDIKVKAGQQLTGGENTEFILISGKATVVSAAGSGLLNESTGSFVGKGISIAPNNVFLVIKADGRGFKAATETRVLIRGTYTVK